MVRHLTHISERKIQRIIKMGLDRGDIVFIRDKPPQYQGTKQITRVYMKNLRKAGSQLRL